MFTVAKIKTADYFFCSEHISEYYASEIKKSDKVARIVKVSDLAKEIEADEVSKNSFYAICNNLRGKKRIGYDLCFSMPKQVSILYALTKNEDIIQAHHEAVMKTLIEIKKYIYVRNRKDQTKKFENADPLFIEFLHKANRNNEIQIHSHVCLMNLARRQDGKFTAVEIRDIFRHQRYITKLYQYNLHCALTARNIHTQLVEKNKRKAYLDIHVNDIVAKVAEKYSTRAQQIQEKIKQEEESLGRKLFPWEVDQIVINTRKEKKILNEQEMMQEVRNTFAEECKKHGISTEVALFFQEHQEQSMRKATYEETRKIVLDAVKILEQTQSLNEKEKVIETVISLAAKRKLQIDMNYVNTAINTHLNIIHTNTDIKREYIISQEMMQIEQQNTNIIINSKEAYERVFTEEEIDKIISNFEKKNFTLSSGQNEAVSMTLRSKDTYVVWQGVAGAGKTTAVEIVANAFKEKGYQIVGLASTGKAADELAKSIGSGQTMHSFLKKAEIQQDKAVIIIDESSMIDSKLANNFLKKINEIKQEGKEIRVVFIGDTNQLQSVQAGRFFSDIQKHAQTAVISEIRRQKNKEYLDLTTALATKNYEYAKQKILQSNKIFATKNSEDLYNFAVIRYMQDTSKSKIIVCQNNMQKDAINTKIRNKLIEQGKLKTKKQIELVCATDNLCEIDKRFAENYSSTHMISFNSEKDVKRILGIDTKDTNFEIVSKNVTNNTLVLRQNNIYTTLNLNNIQSSDYECFSVRDRAIKQFSKNDVVMITKNMKIKQREFSVLKAIFNSKKPYKDTVKELRNGDICKVVDIDIKKGKIKLQKINSNEVIEIKTDKVNYLDYAYAITVHKSQGMTVDSVHYIAEKNVNYNEAYVALTRGKYEYAIYTSNVEDFFKGMAKEQEKTSLQHLTEISQTMKREEEKKYEQFSWLPEKHVFLPLKKKKIFKQYVHHLQQQQQKQQQKQQQQQQKISQQISQQNTTKMRMKM